jgi:hypothetical protein
VPYFDISALHKPSVFSHFQYNVVGQMWASKK